MFELFALRDHSQAFFSLQFGVGGSTCRAQKQNIAERTPQRVRWRTQHLASSFKLWVATTWGKHRLPYEGNQRPVVNPFLLASKRIWRSVFVVFMVSTTFINGRHLNLKHLGRENQSSFSAPNNVVAFLPRQGRCQNPTHLFPSI